MSETDTGIIIDTIQKFNDGFKGIRHHIEEMTDEQLIELYHRASDIVNVSWLIRCTVLGTAYGRTPLGNKTKAAEMLAKEFGIGRRMAELDIRVYNTFIKDNPDFEAVLPAAFYQAAVKTKDPQATIDLAMEKRAEIPSFPANELVRLTKGHSPKEPANKGFFLLVEAGDEKKNILAEAGLNEEGTTELYGHTRLYSIAGHTYLEIT